MIPYVFPYSEFSLLFSSETITVFLIHSNFEIINCYYFKLISRVVICYKGKREANTVAHPLKGIVIFRGMGKGRSLFKSLNGYRIRGKIHKYSGY